MDDLLLLARSTSPKRLAGWLPRMPGLREIRGLQGMSQADTRGQYRSNLDRPLVEIIVKFLARATMLNPYVLTA